MRGVKRQRQLGSQADVGSNPRPVVKGRELPFSWWRTFAGDIWSAGSTIFAGSLRLKRLASQQPLEEDRAALSPINHG